MKGGTLLIGVQFLLRRFLPIPFPRGISGKNFLGKFDSKCLIFLVGAAGFEPTTPSPPDWCANRAAPRPDREWGGL